MDIGKGLRLLIEILSLQFEIQKLRDELRDLQSLRSYSPKDQSLIDSTNNKIQAIQQCYDDLDRTREALKYL
jgi:hypothetical protein